ncbi:MAG: FtsQ-type POTRA domain-containing protein [Parerythrobacter sp.]
MAKIKRKAQGVRRASAAQNRAKSARRARARTGSVLDSAVGMLPFTEPQLQRVFTFVIFATLAAFALLIANLLGVPALARQHFAATAAEAGFVVRNYRVRGLERMNDQKVYNEVLAEHETPMPLVDVEAVRARLLTLSWIRDARVSRQLPQTLVIDIVERTPHAALRKADRLVLIDAEGVELEPVRPEDAKGMLVIGGPGVTRQVASLERLLDAAPALKTRVAEAEWVGNRRWDLEFATGQTVALPHGKREAAAALVSFATLDGRRRLIGGKVAHFDMRVEGRIHLRVPGRGDVASVDAAN